ncbi:MAG: hypothetical protein KAI97_07090 [Gemmatimonadetes bacterium]|nr:hypothetical protein [Gemmatimonadota bacterium]
MPKLGRKLWMLVIVMVLVNVAGMMGISKAETFDQSLMIIKWLGTFNLGLYATYVAGNFGEHATVGKKLREVRKLVELEPEVAKTGGVSGALSAGLGFIMKRIL